MPIELGDILREPDPIELELDGSRGTVGGGELVVGPPLGGRTLVNQMVIVTPLEPKNAFTVSPSRLGSSWASLRAAASGFSPLLTEPPGTWMPASGCSVCLKTRSLSH